MNISSYDSRGNFGSYVQLVKQKIAIRDVESYSKNCSSLNYALSQNSNSMHKTQQSRPQTTKPIRNYRKNQIMIQTPTKSPFMVKQSQVFKFPDDIIFEQ